MFDVTMIVCSLVTGVCVSVTDTRGPYDTLKACVARGIEMERVVIEVPPPGLYGKSVIKWRCRSREKGVDI